MRIWCVRPVTGRKRTIEKGPAALSPRPIRSQWVIDGLPFFAAIMRQPRSAELTLASASSIVPSSSANSPATRPI